jgi:Mg-chelatase subunit ChlD
MKTKHLAISILVATTAVVSAYPLLTQNQPQITLPIIVPDTQQQQQIEVVFALDTTGSMGGLLQTAKEKIWSIATTMASAKGSPQIKMGLVAYRDRGDAYVTKVYDLTSDMDSLYAALMDFKAEGGGDGPEDVNQALFDAVNKMSWSASTNTYKTIFVVGDAPPHTDYRNQVSFQQSLKIAKQKGITVNTVQCGNQADTLQPWKQIAALGSGQYFQVEQAGGAVAITTPHDRKIAELSSKLDETKLYYGNKQQKLKQKAKQDATKKIHKDLSFASRARRAEYNASASGRKNFLGENELVNDIASGKIKLDKITSENLPSSIAVLPAEQRKPAIVKLQKERLKLNQELNKITGARADYLKKEAKKLGGLKGSLDEKIYAAVKQQAEEKGIKYEADSASY